jgi:O-antigen/teichoic acid export membrane protein
MTNNLLAPQEAGKQPTPASGTLARSIGTGTLFGILANGTQVATRLVTVPIVIHHLGLDGYGIWNIIMMTATYMRFGSIGVKTAYQKYVAEATGNGDYDRANKLLSTGCAVMLVLSVAGLIPISFFSKGIAKAAGVPANFLHSAAGAISLLALIMVMANVGAAFEAIVMGGHRIDLVRKFGTILTIAEAFAIVILLHWGFGLFAMAGVMGSSELIYILCCYFAAGRVVPEIKVSLNSVNKGVLHELFRYAGSYQLVNLLEVLYSSLIPFTVLRTFGATSAGVYAVVNRVVGAAVVIQESFLPPILSGGTMVYASGSTEKMRALLVKAFKVTLGLSLLPLGFIAVFGTTMAYAWTGEMNAHFRVAFWFICLRSLFGAFSLLALVLYRVSGKALLDNVRQAVRIASIIVIIIFAHRLGFYGVLAGLAFTEMLGMLFMVFALTKTFEVFRAKNLLPDTLRVTAASIIIFGAGVAASYIPLPVSFTGRSLATLRLLEIALVCAIVSWPSLVRTGSVTSEEGKAMFGAFLPTRKPTFAKS